MKRNEKVEKGYSVLMSAIVEQAISDLRMLKANGRIKPDGTMNPVGKYHGEYRHDANVLELLRFFYDGHAEVMMRACGLTTDMEVVLNKLGLPIKRK